MQPLADNEQIVLCVAPDLIDAYWPHVRRYLCEGMQVAEMDAGETVAALVRGEYRLWVVTTDDHSGVRAAFLTAIGSKGRQRVIEVGALSGWGVWRWARAVSSRMADYARAEGAATYRFCGPPAWARLLPECRVTGQHKSGLPIFEGDAA